MESLPFDVVIHADWGVAPAKRVMAMARRAGSGWRVSPPARVPPDPLPALRALAAEGAALLFGHDFPAGLPPAWAAGLGLAGFQDLLAALAAGHLPDLLRPAATLAEVSWARPFFPARPGFGPGARARWLARLGLSDPAALYRLCDRGQPGGRAAAALMFWLIGPQQVGKGALAGWETLHLPASALPDVRVWPFAGTLRACAAPGTVTLAETYPAEAYGVLGLAPPGRRLAKRTQAGRAACGPALVTAFAAIGADLPPDLVAAVETGFGLGPEGEDPFDALAGLALMLWVVAGRWPESPPLDPQRRTCEGWMLGMARTPA